MYKENANFSEHKEYLKPKSLSEALRLLEEYGDEACILAGGTDLYVRKQLLKRVIIDISEANLDYVKIEKDGLRIGAGTTFVSLKEQLANSPYSVISDAAGKMGSAQIRNMATIGGNLCNAAPSADGAPALYVLGAQVKLTGLSGSRMVPLEEFIIGAGKKVLGKGEILEEIQVPVPDPKLIAIFDKVTRTKGVDLAIVNGAIAVVLDEQNVCKDVKICMGTVAPTPLRIKEAEEFLKGKQLTESNIEAAAEITAKTVRPRQGSARASAEYRQLRSRVLVKRGLGEIIKRAEQV